jgi:hypothetical protein
MSHVTAGKREKMGLSHSTDELVGKTFDEARQFIKDYRVYHTGHRSRIHELRYVHPGGLYTKEYCPARLNVFCDEEGKITEICRCG